VIDQARDSVMSSMKWGLPQRLLDSFVFPRLSEYKNVISRPGARILLNMADLEWADALSLLMLGVTLKSHIGPGAELALDLGD
jgi:hypothetical protein